MNAIPTIPSPTTTTRFLGVAAVGGGASASGTLMTAATRQCTRVEVASARVLEAETSRQYVLKSEIHQVNRGNTQRTMTAAGATRDWPRRLARQWQTVF